ncbi:S46 family peptidase [Cytophagaceae bacterium ABcell3]|nr:S46 family peptidase [Cytophagaceae bacterium ABcell3]
MFKRVICLSFIFLTCFQNLVKADEGMWLPLLIERNFEEMERLGIKLTPEDIYSVNNSSIKDAIVNFGGFCTGEIVSDQGLILTNHHCGYESIQTHSSVENDYLSDGFWASSHEEEKFTEGLSVTFLVRMEDVTSEVLAAASSGDEQAIQAVTEELESKAVEGTHYDAEIKDFYGGNEYYLFVYETFEDVRLVGAPPSSIGKFGGDTDNWMWPRHTGDFAFFRVYAGPDGKPAAYDPDNVPLQPRHHLPVSLKGVEKGDFTMVLGYPGNTQRYLTSEGLREVVELKNSARIKIREKRLEVMKADMDASEEIRIKYSPKYYQVSNYYKYFIGQNQGVKRLNVIDRKKKEEQAFMEWVQADESRKGKYGNLMDNYEKIYDASREVTVPYVYLEEALLAPEVMLLAYQMNEFYEVLSADLDQEIIDSVTAELRDEMRDHFKNYNAPTDRNLMVALFEMYYNDVDKEFHPSAFDKIKKNTTKSFERLADRIFKKSMLVSEEKVNAFLDNPTAEALEKDVAFQLAQTVIQEFREKAGPVLGGVYMALGQQERVYLSALKQLKEGKNMYPDANFSMRLTYGTVQSYYPRDGVKYLHGTTLRGIMEKEDPDSEEFIVPAKLKELHDNNDFGRYESDGTVPVCFITNNDITGGNSGSPVINAEGHLIGTAFDGNWEAMSGDLVFEPELQRCIVTDIRYVLFIVDKFAGATHLIEEMTLIEADEEAEVEEMEEAVPQEVD